MGGEKVLELRNLTKRFGNVVAVNNLSIPYVNRGEFVTFLGPSGCGKTTLLRMIAGFYYPTSGDIIMHGERINDIPPEKRRTGMVFQNYALFPHMNVYDNIAYGLKLRKLSKEKIRRKVTEILSIVQLEGLEKRRPSELSGGQQQRVALARCIVLEPEIILLDEPLSNLDASLRVLMREEIRKIQRSLDLTTIFVTHDQEEAMSMSDRIVVMNKGEVEQIGTAFDIYGTPESLFVASFIGYINLIDGTVKERFNDEYVMETNLGVVRNKNESLKNISKGDTVTLIIRPESASIEMLSVKSQENCFQGRIQNCIYIGSVARYRIHVEKLELPFVVDVPDPGGKDVRKVNEVVMVRLPTSLHCIKK
ncbi:MAG: hypothetical protein AMS17_05895 [Spirochaetes bacterium DG_61]|jgi:spermidine/putrescine ABC transporter ATP-binding subunit|nr:MAG: hypothetical protein AMS17_05895 [Spirochaetes bacterium DG_61]